MQPSETLLRFHLGPIDIKVVRTAKQHTTKADQIIYEHMVEMVKNRVVSIVPESTGSWEYSYRVDTIKWNTRVLWNYDKYYGKRLDKISKQQKKRQAA